MAVTPVGFLLLAREPRTQRFVYMRTEEFDNRAAPCRVSCPQIWARWMHIVYALHYKLGAYPDTALKWFSPGVPRRSLQANILRARPRISEKFFVWQSSFILRTREPILQRMRRAQSFR